MLALSASPSGEILSLVHCSPGSRPPPYSPLHSTSLSFARFRVISLFGLIFFSLFYVLSSVSYYFPRLSLLVFCIIFSLLSFIVLLFSLFILPCFIIFPIHLPSLLSSLTQKEKHNAIFSQMNRNYLLIIYHFFLSFSWRITLSSPTSRTRV